VRPFDVVIAAHGPLAESLLGAAEMICGAFEGATAVGLQPDDTPEAYLERLTAALDPGRPTLVITDLYGGTPHNVACTLHRRGAANLRLIAGANLGLVIEALTAHDPLDDALVARLVASARDAVVDVSSRLAARR
jgi:D-glucosaminate PTS system EIIA component